MRETPDGVILATGKKLGRPSLCGTSQLGWCVPGRLWDDPPLSHPTFAWDIPDGWNVPRDVGRPTVTRLGCPSSAGLSQFGWAVPVWLGCPSCGPPTLGQAVPFHWVIPALHGTSHAAGLSQFGCGLSQFGWGVPVWLGCPSCGHPTLKRELSHATGRSQCRLGRPMGGLSQFG